MDLMTSSDILLQNEVPEILFQDKFPVYFVSKWFSNCEKNFYEFQAYSWGDQVIEFVSFQDYIQYEKWYFFHAKIFNTLLSNFQPKIQTNSRTHLSHIHTLHISPRFPTSLISSIFPKLSHTSLPRQTFATISPNLSFSQTITMAAFEKKKPIPIKYTIHVKKPHDLSCYSTNLIIGTFKERKKKLQWCEQYHISERPDKTNALNSPIYNVITASSNKLYSMHTIYYTHIRLLLPKVSWRS